MTGYITLISRKNGETFANGRKYLYSAPFATRTQAEDWFAAWPPDTVLERIEKNDGCHPSKVIV